MKLFMYRAMCARIHLAVFEAMPDEQDDMAAAFAETCAYAENPGEVFELARPWISSPQRNCIAWTFNTLTLTLRNCGRLWMLKPLIWRFVFVERVRVVHMDAEDVGPMHQTASQRCQAMHLLHCLTFHCEADNTGNGVCSVVMAVLRMINNIQATACCAAFQSDKLLCQIRAGWQFNRASVQGWGKCGV